MMTDEECEADDRARQAARFRPVERAEFDPGHIAAWMSCPGREEALGRTLDSLHWRTWPGKRTYAKDVNPPRGQAQTFFELLARAWQTPGFTYLTMFEDDLAAAENALLYIATTKIPDDVAMVSWFHRFAPNPPQAITTWMIGPAHEFSHQQAITLPAKTVKALLASKELREWSEPHAGDMLIGQVMPDADVAYHFPNIVQHEEGEASLTGNVGSRRSCTFVGESFDAFDLTR